MTTNKRSLGTTGSLSSMMSRAGAGLTNVRAVGTDTRDVSLHGKLIVEGRYLATDGVAGQVVVTVSPSAVDKKLFIRQMNDRLQGKTPPSNTSTEALRRR